MKTYIAAPLALLLAAAAPAADSAGSAAQRVRADVEFLSSDLLEGRDTGSRGYGIAAAYVASQFRSIGLEPGGTDGGWYQQVPFRQAAHAAAPAAGLTIGDRETGLRPGTDFAVRPSLTEKARAIDAPLVFAGHGISDARAGIDNYAGLDVRGKIVLVLGGTPPGLPSEVAAHLDSWKSATAAAKGAAGLIEIAGTRARGGSASLAPYARPTVDWVDPSGTTVSQSTRLALNGAISKGVAEKLFIAARQDFSGMLSESRKAGTIRGFSIPARLRVQDRMEWRDFTSPNVVGMLRGSDPALGDEHIVLMGHLDHLGTRSDARPGEDGIHNGAIDNAAGIATMIEAARKFVQSGERPRRSVLFVAVTGEEKGLRGADHFAASAGAGAGTGKIVGVVNLDMPMLLYPFTDVVAFGGDRSTVAAVIGDAAATMGVTVSPDPMPEQAIFTRSDHYPFVTRGIPSILLMTGYANGGEAKWKDFFANIYHKPNDDLSLPILWDQGARYAELNYRIAQALADADDRPRWYQGDYFGDMFAPGQERAPR